MTKPTTRTYIAFDTGWTGTPTWVEVTSKVRHDPGIDISTWRSEELSEASPNTFSLVLRNDDGRFTPGNTASPYYPNVKKGRRIKVESTTAAGTSVRLTGYIDDWRPAWIAGVGGINDCSVTASSRMARIGKGAELRSVVENEVMLGIPTAYYTLSEPTGSTMVSDTSGSNAGLLRVTGTGMPILFGTGTGTGTDGLTAVTFAGGQYLSGTTGGATLSMFVLSTGNGELISGTGPSNSSLTVTISGTTMSVALLATNTNTANLSASLTAGVTHHIGLVGTGATASLYVDGTLADSAGLAGTVAVTDIKVGQGWSGTMSHLSFGHSTADFPGIAAAGLTGFAGETCAARITRYAGYLGIAPADLSLDTGQVPDLAPDTDVAGHTALDAMRTVEATEEGVLFDARDGTLTFHDRAHRYSAASAFTLSYSAGQIANTLEPVLDDQRQRNDVTVTSTDGQLTGKATDQTSVDEHGWYRESFTVATTDPDEPFMHASWLVNSYAEPEERVSAVEVLLNTATLTLTTQLLAATVGTRLTLTGLPANAPAPTMDLFVEGTEEHITNDEHRIVFHTSPAAISDVWTVEDPVLGQYDAYPLAF